MVHNTENRRIFNFDWLPVILVLFLGLLIYRSLPENNSPRPKNSPVVFISASDQNAVSNSSERLHVYQKTWISNKDNFNILAFNRNPVTENRMTDLKINSLQLKVKKFKGVYLIYFPQHLFSSETDDPLDFS